MCYKRVKMSEHTFHGLALLVHAYIDKAGHIIIASQMDHHMKREAYLLKGHELIKELEKKAGEVESQDKHDDLMIMVRKVGVLHDFFKDMVVRSVVKSVSPSIKSAAKSATPSVKSAAKSLVGSIARAIEEDIEDDDEDEGDVKNTDEVEDEVEYDTSDETEDIYPVRYSGSPARSQTRSNFGRTK